MRLNVVAFVAGVWLLQQQADLPGPQTGVLLAALIAGTLLLSWGFGGVGRRASGEPNSESRFGNSVFLAFLASWPWIAPYGRRVLLLTACCGAGFAWAALMAGLRLADSLPPDWEGRDLRIEGVVASLPQLYERSVRFEFDVERVLTPEAVVPQHIVLSWWGSPAVEGKPPTIPDLAPGER